MHRFYYFPLVLGLYSGLSVWWMWFDTVFLVQLPFLPLPGSPWFQIKQLTSFIGAYVGYVTLFGVFAVGVPSTIYDFWRNGPRDRRGVEATARMIPNLFWHSVYGAVLILVNYLVFMPIYWYADDHRSSDSLIILSRGILVFFPMVVHFLIPILAAIRSIQDEEILVPSRLKAVLRQSARLENTN